MLCRLPYPEPPILRVASASQALHAPPHLRVTPAGRAHHVSPHLRVAGAGYSTSPTSRQSWPLRIVAADQALVHAASPLELVIPRNTTIPVTVKRNRPFTTVDDYQTSTQIRVYEGEGKLAKENNLLGKFDLTGILPEPKGEPKITVTFDIDANGVLEVTALDNTTGNTNNIAIVSEKKLSKEEIERMVQNADKYKWDDKKMKKIKKERGGL